ncbi:hypothetical protein MMC11_005457 [Xylographa trunciseda]|nr:hypothetical protein [Xylographa trunciseda]
MTAVASKDQQQLFGRKRRRGAIEEEHSATATPNPPRKRVKRRRQSKQETNAAYWDSLSKLWLTRRALDELDRRNRQRASPVRPTVARNLDLGDEPAQLENLSKRLKRFARHGGPDLRDLGGVSLAREMSRSLLISYLQYPEPFVPNSTAHVMPSYQSSSRIKSKSRNTLGDSTAKTTTSKTKKTSPYDPNFEQNLIDNSIYPDDYDFPDGRDPPRPDNENEILSRLGQPRPSLSPSQFSNKEFRTFKQTNSRALNEDAVMSDVFPVIQGTARIPFAKNLVFGNLEPLTYGNFVDAKPDFYDGAYSAQINMRIREELGSYIIPATQGQAPALPTFFTEVKGPDGSGAVAKRQACYDGVLGERGIREFMAFGVDDSERVYDNNAYTITSTYHSATGTLQVYTIHQTQPIDHENPPEYHMTQLNTFAITGTAERFREGVGAFRNARDWAKEQRDGLIVAANGRAMGMPKETTILEPPADSMSRSSIGPDAVESETSADELSQDVGRGPSLSNKRLKRESEKRSSNPELKVRSKKSYSGANSRSRSRGRLSQKR